MHYEIRKNALKVQRYEREEMGMDASKRLIEEERREKEVKRLTAKQRFEGLQSHHNRGQKMRQTPAAIPGVARSDGPHKPPRDTPHHHRPRVRVSRDATEENCAVQIVSDFVPRASIPDPTLSLSLQV